MQNQLQSDKLIKLIEVVLKDGRWVPTGTTIRIPADAPEFQGDEWADIRKSGWAALDSEEFQTLAKMIKESK